jgi:hypothetical protein
MEAFWLKTSLIDLPEKAVQLVLNQKFNSKFVTSLSLTSCLMTFCLNIK